MEGAAKHTVSLWANIECCLSKVTFVGTLVKEPQAMNPLISGLFSNFRESVELTDLADADAFELFVAAQLLPDEILEQAELSDLLLDSSTIGIDLAVLEINGALIWDIDDVDDLCAQSPKLDVSLHIAQAKRSPKVESSRILAMGDVSAKILNNDNLDSYPKLKTLMSVLRRSL